MLVFMETYKPQNLNIWMKFNVESEFEVILTHIPLWKNESPLFMIGRMLDNHMMKCLVKQDDVIDTIKSFLESESSVSDRPIVQYSWFLLKSGDQK